MTIAGSSGLKLGINGFGRIGKLTVWHHVARKYFDEIVVNIGRQAGVSLKDIAHYVERDSTYGWLHGYLYGHMGQPVVEDLDENSGSMVIDGVKVVFLRNHRNPAEIGWGDHDVRLVVDTTGQFLDPRAGLDHPQGTLRGHLESGADKVILSAPFKLNNGGTSIPEDSISIVLGINKRGYDPRCHKIISNASRYNSIRRHVISLGDLSVIVSKSMAYRKPIQNNPSVTKAKVPFTTTVTRKRSKVTKTYLSEISFKFIPPSISIVRKPKQIDTTESITRQ